MNYYKARIQYDGTNYFGFQWQKDIPTIQHEINLALKKLLGPKVSTVGASRTDTGVHALEQIIKITTESLIDCEVFLGQINLILPSQIRFLTIDPCEGTFNPIAGSASKEYRYLFTTILKSTQNDQRFIANHPYELDVELMRECLKMVKGKHDFHNFCSTGSNVKTTVREILETDLTAVDPHHVLPEDSLFHLPEDLRECFQLRIVGHGFLKQMVRHLMSALWLVGSRRLTLDEFSKLLNGPPKPKRLWKVAQARGLYLYQSHLRK